MDKDKANKKKQEEVIKVCLDNNLRDKEIKSIEKVIKYPEIREIFFNKH